jgi:uncharacterized protein (TIGR02118 family)
MRNNEDKNMSRRQVLTASGVIGAGAAVGSGKVSAAESIVGQECMTIVYHNGPDVRFDFDYYESTHMPLIMRLYGESISRFELRRGPPPAADGTLSPFIATISIWIANAEAFDRAAAEHQEGSRADVDTFTNAVVVAQRDQVVAIDTR